MINRRDFLASAAAAAATQALPAATRPNVLLFMTDQESAQAPTQASRPNYDRLKARSVRFSNAFCNTPQCSPARSSLMTGLQPHETHVLTNVDPGSLGKNLSPGIATAGDVFQKAGYKTAYFGKWHLSGAADLNDFGFSVHGQGPDRQVATAAAQWISKQITPWFAWVSVLNPHDIYDILQKKDSVVARPGIQPPASTRADIQGKPAAQLEYLEKDQGRPTLKYTTDDWLLYRSFYCDLLEKADACLGIVLGALPKPDNTIIAYVSDHGDMLGEHGLPFKGPFMYEPVVRIPLMFASPGLRPATRSDFITSADVLPTLAGHAGVTWTTKISGRDASHAPTARDAVFLDYYGKQKTVTPIRTIRTDRWKLNWYDNGDQELYDLSVDPNELHNLATDEHAAATRKDLEARIDAWRPKLT